MKSRPPVILSSAAAIAASSLLPSASSFSSAFIPITEHLRTSTLLSRHDQFALRMDLNDDSSTTTTINGKEEVITTTSSTSWSIGSPSPKLAEEARKKLVAKEALTKLLARQQSDVQQTLDLIANLELEGYEQSIFESDDQDNNSTLPSSSSSSMAKPATIAASIAAAADYGFISRSEGCRVPYNKYDTVLDERFQDYGPPSNILSLGSQQFMRNLRAMFNEYQDESDKQLTPRQIELQEQLSTLTLNSTAIWERERSRGPLIAPLIIKTPYYVLCYLLDVVFEGRNPFQRFFLLETVARMPYFSYITMLHLYETLGFWRRSADIKRIHFAEEWNEFHHLLIQESLGGDQPFYVRFMAQHSALVYYVVLCVLWMASPSLSYKFSEMLETHAVDTYGQFIDENEDKLKELPPSLIAVEYYTVGISDPMFGEMQTKHNGPSAAKIGAGGAHRVRKSGMSMKSLYDVFVAIRNDEGDHVNTMQSCLDPTAPTLSQGLESRVLTGVALTAAASYLFGNYPGFDSLNGMIDSLSTVTTGGGGDIAMDGLTEMTSELDQILTDSSNDAPGIMNGIVGGLAGLANRLNDLNEKGLSTEATEAVEVDENTVTDVAGSALEDVAGGLEGFEMEAIVDAIRNVIVAILELIPFA
jgi:ubiquinol oxidase